MTRVTQMTIPVPEPHPGPEPIPHPPDPSPSPDENPVTIIELPPNQPSRGIPIEEPIPS